MGKELFPSVKSTESERVGNFVKKRSQEAKAKGQIESLYVSLAHLFLQEGQRDLERLDLGLRDISKGILSRDLLPRWNYAVVSAHASIFFAITVKEIEQILAKRVFDSYTYHASHDNALSNFGFINKFNTPMSQPTKIPKSQWGEMIDFSREDPTLAIFFEKRGSKSLPEEMQHDIMGAGVSYIIRQDILPKYQEWAANIRIPDFELARYPSLEAQKAV